MNRSLSYVVLFMQLMFIILRQGNRKVSDTYWNIYCNFFFRKKAQNDKAVKKFLKFIGPVTSYW